MMTPTLCFFYPKYFLPYGWLKDHWTFHYYGDFIFDEPYDLFFYKFIKDYFMVLFKLNLYGKGFIFIKTNLDLYFTMGHFNLS